MDIGIEDAMMSPIIPMTQKQETDQKAAEMDRVSKMNSDTQILLAIFEKVVCIEDKIKNAESASAPAPQSVQLSVDSFAGGI